MRKATRTIGKLARRQESALGVGSNEKVLTIPGCRKRGRTESICISEETKVSFRQIPSSVASPTRSPTRKQFSVSTTYQGMQRPCHHQPDCPARTGPLQKPSLTTFDLRLSHPSLTTTRSQSFVHKPGQPQIAMRNPYSAQCTGRAARPIGCCFKQHGEGRECASSCLWQVSDFRFMSFAESAFQRVALQIK